MKITATRFGRPFKKGEEKKQKSKSFVSIVLFLICAVVTVLVLTIIFEHSIRYVVAGQEETWAASIASYWGGIIGGAVSGIFAFLGVFYTIRYYKDSDAQKERASVQPFLFVKIGQNNSHEMSKEFCLGEAPKEKEKQKEIGISIHNIGNGFATTLVIHTGYNVGGLAFKKVIPVGGSAYTFFVVDSEKLKDGLNFAIQYIDSMTNEYIQEYNIVDDSGNIEIECGYPNFLKL